MHEIIGIIVLVVAGVIVARNPNWRDIRPDEPGFRNRWW